MKMADWLYDAQASRERGRDTFRLPYPGGDWWTEKQNNDEFLILMETAYRVHRLSVKVKAGKKLTKDEDELFDMVMDIVAEAEDQ